MNPEAKYAPKGAKEFVARPRVVEGGKPTETGVTPATVPGLKAESDKTTKGPEKDGSTTIANLVNGVDKKPAQAESRTAPRAAQEAAAGRRAA